MGIFKEDTYIKQKNGVLKLVDSEIVKAPHDVGRWEKSAELDLKNKGDYTSFQTETTKSGVNKKVTKVFSRIENDTFVCRELITTSNKLSQKDREKYKNVKGFDNPRRR